MELTKKDADLYVPDGAAMPQALERTTHLCVGAHQDDQEFMAYHGIAECFGREDLWFSGVVLTNGSGSARTGIYGDYTDEQMMAVRRREQRKAAHVGEYACQIQLMYPSSELKHPANAGPVKDLERILEIARPEIVYLHNPADKHDTHVASMLRAVAALRAMPAGSRPRKVYGCEVWRDLDWLVDEDKELLPVDGYANLASALAGVFDSQLTGGKRYDRAIAGRWRANATMYASHEVDETDALSYALDLTPLIDGPEVSPVDYTLQFVDRLRADVESRLRKLASE